MQKFAEFVNIVSQKEKKILGMEEGKNTEKQVVGFSLVHRVN